MAEPAEALPVPAADALDAAPPSGPLIEPSTESGTAPPIEPPAAPTPVPLAFSFTGTASDYFRIWIVNLLLNLVTLGLWSPWSKVRKRRYFYGHTWVAGA